MTTPKNCPSCGTAWEEEETIFEFFLKSMDVVKAKETAKMYGCMPDNPKHFGKNVIGIETEEYDGVSIWECQKCNSQFSRWTMEKLNDTSL